VIFLIKFIYQIGVEFLVVLIEDLSERIFFDSVLVIAVKVKRHFSLLVSYLAYSFYSFELLVVS
jgi:hypothetical protein